MRQILLYDVLSLTGLYSANLRRTQQILDQNVQKRYRRIPVICGILNSNTDSPSCPLARQAYLASRLARALL